MWVGLEEDKWKLILKALKVLTVKEAKQAADEIKRRMAEEKDKNGTIAAYRATADERYGHDGELEFDDDAVVSLGDDPGAYVMCWRWVDADDAKVETGDDE